MAVLTKFDLVKDLTTIGITPPAGFGGHLIIPISATEWIGAVSSDNANLNSIVYRTTDAWTTLSVVGTVAEPAGSTIMMAFARSGTTVLWTPSDAATAPDSATIYRSVNTGLTYALAQNVGGGGFRRVYGLFKMSNGSWIAGLGQDPAPRYYTSATDGASWVDQGVFAGEGANRMFACPPIEVGTSGRIIVAICDRLSILGANNVTLYTADSFMTGTTTSRISGLGLLSPWPCRLYQSTTTGTLFASIPKGVGDNAIYRSTDLGVTWTPIAGTPEAQGDFAEISGILVVPKGGASPGIYQSVNDGLTWSLVTVVGSFSQGFMVRAAPDNSAFYFSAMSGTGGGANAHPLIFMSNPIVSDPLTGVLFGDFNLGKIRLAFAGALTDDEAAVTWQVKTRPVFGGSPQTPAYFRRLVLKVANVTAAQTFTGQALIGPKTTTTVRTVDKTFVCPAAATLAYTPEVDLTMDLGLIGTDSRVTFEGSGPLTIRGLEYHLKQKPIGRPTAY
jgi:hypothetical protein